MDTYIVDLVGTWSWPQFRTVNRSEALHTAKLWLAYALAEIPREPRSESQIVLTHFEDEKRDAYRVYHGGSGTFVVEGILVQAEGVDDAIDRAKKLWRKWWRDNTCTPPRFRFV